MGTCHPKVRACLYIHLLFIIRPLGVKANQAETRARAERRTRSDLGTVEVEYTVDVLAKAAARMV